MSSSSWDNYNTEVRQRSLIRFVIGLIPRVYFYLKFSFIRYIARRMGGVIGEGVMMPFSLARRANSNLEIGDHSIVGTSQLDLRCKVKIGKNVIITSPTCRVITLSHNIDSPQWEHKRYGIEIEDYVWIPNDVLILPSCRKIGYGAVVSSGSVVVKDVEPMSVVGGNPAKAFKKRACVHSEHLMEQSQTADLKYYWKAYLK